jgi:general stress protein 26
MTMNRKELEKKIIEFLKKHNGGTLATVREDGTPQASGISFVNDGLTIYFAMDPESHKKKNVDHNHNVGLATFKDYYRWDKAKAVQLAGKCEIVTDEHEISKIERLLLEKFPWVVKCSAAMEWAARAGPLPYYKITPKVIAYLDYQEYGFNKFETLEL